MAESAQGGAKWKRKRLLMERAALARAAKQAKLESTSSDRDDPGPSRPLPAREPEDDQKVITATRVTVKTKDA